jgi:hypothetical protein
VAAVVGEELEGGAQRRRGESSWGMGWTTTRSGAAEWRKQQTAREESSSAACRVVVLLQLGQHRPTVAASIGVGLAVDAAQERLADGGADDAVDDRALRHLWRVHQLGGEALETEHLVVVHDYGVDEHTELVVVHQRVRAAAARTVTSDPRVRGKKRALLVGTSYAATRYELRVAGRRISTPASSRRSPPHPSTSLPGEKRERRKGEKGKRDMT